MKIIRKVLFAPFKRYKEGGFTESETYLEDMSYEDLALLNECRKELGLPAIVMYNSNGIIIHKNLLKRYDESTENLKKSLENFFNHRTLSFDFKCVSTSELKKMWEELMQNQIARNDPFFEEEKLIAIEQELGYRKNNLKMINEARKEAGLEPLNLNQI